MATATGYQVTGLVEWRNITDANAFQKRLVRNIRRATKLNALATVKEMRATIQSGDFKPNAPLTVAIKGSGKPLVAGGDLFQSVSMEELNPDEIFVGVKRTEGAYDLVEVIHNGATIPVTPAMRWMFLMLAKASDGEMDPGKLDGRAAELFGKFQGWKPIANSTSAIVIPARPFAEVAFAKPALIKLCQDNWAQAIQLALNPPKRDSSSALAKTTKKLGKKAAKLGKKYGKKALKAGKKYGKKAARSGKRIGKKGVRSAKRFSKRVGKSARRVGKKAKSYGKKVIRRARGGGRKKR